MMASEDDVLSALFLIGFIGMLLLNTFSHLNFLSGFIISVVLGGFILLIVILTLNEVKQKFFRGIKNEKQKI